MLSASLNKTFPSLLPLKHYITSLWLLSEICLKLFLTHVLFQEALLHRQSKERRIAVSEGPNYKPPSYPKCCHIKDDSTRCSGRTVPLSKFCAKRILWIFSLLVLTTFEVEINNKTRQYIIQISIKLSF